MGDLRHMIDYDCWSSQGSPRREREKIHANTKGYTQTIRNLYEPVASKQFAILGSVLMMATEALHLTAQRSSIPLCVVFVQVNKVSPYSSIKSNDRVSPQTLISVIIHN